MSTINTQCLKKSTILKKKYLRSRVSLHRSERMNLKYEFTIGKKIIWKLLDAYRIIENQIVRNKIKYMIDIARDAEKVGNYSMESVCAQNHLSI